MSLTIWTLTTFSLTPEDLYIKWKQRSKLLGGQKVYLTAECGKEQPWKERGKQAWHLWHDPFPASSSQAKYMWAQDLKSDSLKTVYTLQSVNVPSLLSTLLRPPYWVILSLEQHHVILLIYFTHENIWTKRCDITCSRSQTSQLARPRFTSKLSLKPTFLGTVLLALMHTLNANTHTYTHTVFALKLYISKEIKKEN